MAPRSNPSLTDSLTKQLKALSISSSPSSSTPNAESSSTSTSTSLTPPSIISIPPSDTTESPTTSNLSSSEDRDNDEDIPPCSFEVRPTKHHGFGLFSNRRIPAGTLIFTESPLISLPKTLETDPAQIEAAFQTLTKPNRKIYLRLHDAKKSRMSQVASIYYSNCYSKDGFTDPASEGGSCLGALASRLNHSCVPNVAFSYIPPNSTSSLPTGQMQFHAIKHIPSGKELMSCYEKNIFLARQERSRRNMMYYGFNCDCEACTPTTSFWEKSDERRSKMAILVREIKEVDAEWDSVMSMSDSNGNDGNDRKSHEIDTVHVGRTGTSTARQTIPEKAITLLLALEALLIKEALTHTPLANTYRSLAKWTDRLRRPDTHPAAGGASDNHEKPASDNDKSTTTSSADNPKPQSKSKTRQQDNNRQPDSLVKIYKAKELAVCQRCFGSDAVRPQALNRELAYNSPAPAVHPDGA